MIKGKNYGAKSFRCDRYEFLFQAIFELYRSEVDLLDDLIMVKKVSPKLLRYLGRISTPRVNLFKLYAKVYVLDFSILFIRFSYFD